MRAAIRFLGELIRAWKHRRAHWHVLSDRVMTGCMGDWREVRWGCNACGEEIIGTSELSLSDYHDRIARLRVVELNNAGVCPGRLTVA